MAVRFRRLHTEILVQIAKDRPLEEVVAEFDFEQDDDSVTFIKQTEVTLAQDAALAEITKPTGATTIKFLAITGVDSTTGIEVANAAADDDPWIVAAPATVSAGSRGYFVTTVTMTNLYVGNPNATGIVSADILMVCV